jgi:mannan endo-1,4-beta-mannosidase
MAGSPPLEWRAIFGGLRGGCLTSVPRHLFQEYSGALKGAWREENGVRKTMRIYRQVWLAVVFMMLLSLLTAIGAAQVAAAGGGPAAVNPHASPEAGALLRYLDSISGRYTITGQHNFPNESSRWTDRTYDLTGKYPGLFGADFGFSAGDDKDSIEGRAAMIAEVERQYRNGAVIALTWHAVRPTEDEPVTFRDSVQGHLTDFEWKELLTPGTDLYERWCAQVDVIAGYLAQLRDAHVAVLFRPYHEMNGNWFWWGGRPGKNGSAALYRQLYDRYVNLHRLDNLVWVWNVNSPSASAGAFVDYFPGTEYVDVPSVDNYGEFKQSYYDDVLALAGNKPVALAEVGGVPTLDVLKAQPKWTYFMIWAGLAEILNPAEKLKEVFDGPNLLNRGDPRLAEAMQTMRKSSGDAAPEPVTGQAAAEAKALLARLYGGSGKSVVSGQENGVEAVTGATQHVVQVTGKTPVIYGAELEITREDAVEASAARQAIVEEAKRQSRNHAIVSLSWHPGRPTDDEPGSREQSVGGQLTDFEWNELLTPDTALYRRWCAQVDDVAKYLKQLQDSKVAMLWQPYPEPNGKKFWWAGRKGAHGSAALYRQLFDRMVNHDGLRNLIWVWSAAPPGFGPNASGAYSDFFPGLLYVDALALNVENFNSRFRMDTSLANAGVGKVIGIEASKIPDPAFFTQQTGWAWFSLSAEKAVGAGASSSPAGASTPAESADAEALRKLYSDSHVISEAVERQGQTATKP